jgi:photosystem II stability/assembly factor-like uncharacterized protein
MRTFVGTRAVVAAVAALVAIVGGLAFISRSLPAQATPGDATAALLADYKWRNIGPGSPGGRISDVDALDSDFRYVIAAAASGGVWKSTNAGTTWTPIFERYGSSSIGDVKIFQGDRNILWVGTGEANNRNSVAWGDGIYKSTDAGKTFINVGLRNTFQIARIVTHPKNADIAYVAAVGNLWASTGERGLFKTIDGGKIWQKLAGGLPNVPTSGATDLVMDPTNPEVLYTAFYERVRLPWRLESGGTNGGIFKSTDGGKSWKKLAQGLPAGWTGRIGLDIYRKNPRVLMAIVEADGAAADMVTPAQGIYRSEDGGATWKFVNRYNNRPFYYSQIRINPSDDQLVYVLTTSFQWSTDGGKTFAAARAPFGSNYDHHAMWIDPANKDRFYLGKDKGLTLTHDHGASFIFFDNLPIMQAYKVAADMREPYAIYAGLQDNGTVGTMSFSRDNLGIRNDVAWKLHWDDGQYIAIDPNDYRTVYSEGTNASFRIVDPIGHTDTPRRIAPANIVNFSEVAPPDAGPGGLPSFRVNWTSPFILSPHNAGVLYYGANYLLKSTDKGVTWTAISKDLTRGDADNRRAGTRMVGGEAGAAEQHATIYTISESPVAAGTIWAGTDDGNVWLTRDDGASWTQVDANIPDVPKGTHVSRIVASAADAATAYVSFDGHRSDNRAPWLFRTTDGGKTWQNLSGGLAPNSPIYVVEEDSRNPDLLFVGTEHGVQLSLDRGRSWRPMTNGLPTVAVYDIVIHPRDRDLILGTHGRGIYVLDDITALEAWRPAIAGKAAHLFTQRQATMWVDMSRSGQLGDNTFAGENPPYVQPADFQTRDRTHIVNTPLVTFYLGAGASGSATLEVTGPDGTVRTMSIPAKPGITRYALDMRSAAAIAAAAANAAVSDEGGGGGGRAGGAGGRGAGAVGGRGAAGGAAGAAGAGGGRGAGGRGAAGGGGAGGGAGGGRGGAVAVPIGVYALKLTIGSSTSVGSLVVRSDPLLRP